jgi:hypothetical protein
MYEPDFEYDCRRCGRVMDRYKRSGMFFCKSCQDDDDEHTRLEMEELPLKTEEGAF